MTAEFQVSIEADPVPIVLMFATMIRRELNHPEVREAARSLDGTFALKSSQDPQAVSITVTGNQIHLQRGISSQARITIIADLERLGEKGYTPRVRNLWRHPWFTYRVSRFLTPSPHQDWTQHARQFWTHAEGRPGMPSELQLTCTDDGQTLTLGEPGKRLEIHGAATALSNLMSGGSLLIADTLMGKVQIFGDFHDLAVVTEATLDQMLGEFSDD